MTCGGGFGGEVSSVKRLIKEGPRTSFEARACPWKETYSEKEGLSKKNSAVCKRA